jgi:hypothetical protein
MKDGDNLVVKTFKDVKTQINNMLEGMDEGLIKDYLVKSFNDGLDDQIIINSGSKNENSKSQQ